MKGHFRGPIVLAEIKVLDTVDFAEIGIPCSFKTAKVTAEAAHKIVFLMKRKKKGLRHKAYPSTPSLCVRNLTFGWTLRLPKAQHKLFWEKSRTYSYSFR